MDPPQRVRVSRGNGTFSSASVLEASCSAITRRDRQLMPVPCLTACLIASELPSAHAQMKRRQMRQQNVIDNLPGAGAMLAAAGSTAPQPVAVGSPPPPAAVSWARQTPPVHPPATARHNIGGMARPLNQAEIHPQVGDGVDDVRAAADAQLDRQIRGSHDDSGQ